MRFFPLIVMLAVAILHITSIVAAGEAMREDPRKNATFIDLPDTSGPVLEGSAPQPLIPPCGGDDSVIYQSFAHDTTGTYYLHTPSDDFSHWAMRFSPCQMEQIWRVDLALYDPGDGTFGDNDITVAICADAGGLPGAVIQSETIDAGTYDAWPTWEVIYFEQHGIFTDQDFHVVVSAIPQTGASHESFIVDDGDHGTTRCSFYDILTGSWYSSHDYYGADFNFLVEVVSCRGCASEKAAGIDFAGDHGTTKPVMRGTLRTDMGWAQESLVQAGGRSALGRGVLSHGGQSAQYIPHDGRNSRRHPDPPAS
jgi:hypothetical protein